MLMLLGGLLYVLGHFALFAAIFRHARAFHAERTIFLYHLISAVVLAMVAGALAMWDVSLLIGAIGLLSIHAIYSITFLELWSLAEGGYSLAILRELTGPRQRGRLQSDSMRTLGGGKVRTRIESLARLGLLRPTGDQVELTRLGRVAGWTQAVFRSMVNTSLPV